MTHDEKITKLEAEILKASVPKQKSILLNDLAMELRYSNPASALRAGKEAMTISEEISFTLGKARSCFSIGVASFSLSEYEDAYSWITKAYHFFQESDDRWGTSNALNQIGLIHFRLGNYEKALENFSASLKIKRDSNDLFGTANVMISMAAIYRETGHSNEAQSMLGESLKISEGLRSDALTSKGLMELGVSALGQNKFTDAEEKFDLARKLFVKQNNSSGIAQCLLHLGKIKSATGDQQAAIKLFEDGHKIAIESGDKSLLTVFLFNIASVKLLKHQPQEALSLLSEAKDIANRTQEKPMQSIISQHLSYVYETVGRLSEAFAEYKNFVTLKEEINTLETTTLLRNQQVSARMEVLEKEKAILEAEKLSAIAELKARLNAQEIKSLNAMMDGQEMERKRIAADLHDRVGGSLAAIKLYIASMAKSGEPGGQPEFAKVTSMFDEVVNEVRQVSHDLISGVLMNFGLVSALKDLAESINGASAIRVNVFSAGFDQRVDHKIEISLYRVVQELMNNILKHSQAKEVNIHLTLQKDHLLLMVEDDGVGFDPAIRSDGIGLSNIRSRVNQLKGTVLFDSMPGNGCTVTIETPIPVIT